jgi:hypothetical protein
MAPVRYGIENYLVKGGELYASVVRFLPGAFISIPFQRSRDTLAPG